MTSDAITQAVGSVRAELPPLAWAYRRSVLREIEDGLRDAQDAYLARGATAAAAADRAVADFGDPREIARELRADAGARSVRRLGAVQAVLVVAGVIGWATVGATSSTTGAAADPVLATVHAVFAVVALPAVVVGLLAHRRLRHAASVRAVRRWGLGTAGAALLTLAATRGTSLVKGAVAHEPMAPGDAWLMPLSNAVALLLLGGVVHLVVQLHGLRPASAGELS